MEDLDSDLVVATGTMMLMRRFMEAMSIIYSPYI